MTNIIVALFGGAGKGLGGRRMGLLGKLGKGGCKFLFIASIKLSCFSSGLIEGVFTLWDSSAIYYKIIPTYGSQITNKTLVFAKLGGGGGGGGGRQT